MAKRKKVKKEDQGDYFPDPTPNREFISTGSTLLDCAIGGGWRLGRVSNIIGDKSSGKTLLCIEATANFARQYSEGDIWYREAESAFDTEYAGSLGMPLDRVNFSERGTFITVEDFFNDVKAITENRDKDRPGIYIVDSLDALSSVAEQERAIEDQTYAMEKAKQLSQLFRRQVQIIEQHNIALLIISQVRDKINAVGFGRKTTRSGGRAMDFYCSIVIYLAQTGLEKKTINKVERPTGVKIVAKVDKNKVSLPYRKCEFPILFGYGIDDLASIANWYKEIGTFAELKKATGLTAGDPKKLVAEAIKLTDKKYKKICEKAATAAKERWASIEQDFKPTRSKY